MKHKYLSFLSFFGFAAIMLLESYSGGPANSNVQATNAPGSSPSKCTSCHTGGSFGPVSIDVQLETDSGNFVTSYVAGETYTVNVSVNHSSGSPAGFGFQMVALNGSSNAGDFMNPSSNAQLEMLSGREYVEHNNPSSSNQFSVDWTAPSSGTGDVTFYLGANAVNGNGTTSGDNAALTNVTFEEMLGDTNNGDPNGIWSIQSTESYVYPNPTSGVVSLKGAAVSNWKVYDIHGRLMMQRQQESEIDLHQLPAGLYFIEHDNGMEKVLKR